MNKSSKAILIILLSILILNFTSAATVSKTVVSEPEQNINSPQAIGIGSSLELLPTIVHAIGYMEHHVVDAVEEVRDGIEKILESS